MHVPPFLPQRLLRSDLGTAVLALLVAVTVSAIVVAARTSPRRDLVCWATAVLSLGAVGAAINVIAPLLGYWSGPVFAAPVLLRGE